MQFTTFTLLALSAFSAPAITENSDAIKVGEAPYPAFWSGCYKDEEAWAKGYQNRDDLIKNDCFAHGNRYQGQWEDCGGWRFRGLCV